MISSFIKISSIILLLISTIIVFISIFINFFYSKEEILDIPIVESNNTNIKIHPKLNKKKDKNQGLELEILNEKDNKEEQHKLVLNEKKT